MFPILVYSYYTHTHLETNGIPGSISGKETHDGILGGHDATTVIIKELVHDAHHDEHVHTVQQPNGHHDKLPRHSKVVLVANLPQGGNETTATHIGHTDTHQDTEYDTNQIGNEKDRVPQGAAALTGTVHWIELNEKGNKGNEEEVDATHDSHAEEGRVEALGGHGDDCSDKVGQSYETESCRPSTDKSVSQKKPDFGARKNQNFSDF